MRTTLSVDDDLNEQLRARERSQQKPFKVVVNEILRAGIDAQAAGPKHRTFGVAPKNLGFREGLNYDKSSDLLDYAEGVDRKW